MSGASADERTFDANAWIDQFRGAGGYVTSRDDGSVIVMHPEPITKESVAVMGQLWHVSDGLEKVERAAWARRDADRIFSLLRRLEGHMAKCSGPSPTVANGDAVGDALAWHANNAMVEDIRRQLARLGVQASLGRA